MQQTLLKHLLKLVTKLVGINLVIGSQSKATFSKWIDMRRYPIFTLTKSSLCLLCSFFNFSFYSLMLYSEPKTKINNCLPPTTTWISNRALKFTFPKSHLMIHLKLLLPHSPYFHPVTAIFSFQVLGPKSLGSSLTLLLLTPNILIVGKWHSI